MDNPAFVLETVILEAVIVVRESETCPVAATWWARAAREMVRMVFMATEMRLDQESGGGGGLRVFGVDVWMDVEMFKSKRAARFKFS